MDENTMNEKQLTAEFKKRASLVSAIVHEAGGMQEALEKAVDLCLKKTPFENLMPAIQNPGEGKILAAPDLNGVHYEALASFCKENGITLIQDDLRRFPGGIDMGLTRVDFGIAETGTLVLNSDSEDIRLCTMLCETHVAILEMDTIRKTALDMAEELDGMVSRPSSYTAFITGASRTADIERVLAIGVHGPVELHIILIPGERP